MKLLLPDQRTLTALDLPDLYDEPGPHLRAGFVVSVDGAVAVDGRSNGLSSPADKAVFRALRTVSDAVLVGAGTARQENYGPVQHQPAAGDWRAAHGRAPETPLVIVSRHGQLDPSSRLLAGPVLLAVPESAQVPDLPVEVLRVGADDVDPVVLVAALRARGLHRLLCEGGPQLLTSLVVAGLVDELCLTVAPTAVGTAPGLFGALPTTEPLELVSLVHDDPGVLLARWRVVRSKGD